MEECQHLLELLRRYEEASSQAINRQKTTIFFSQNTRPEVKMAIQGMVGVRIMENCEKHLGLPMMRGKSKVSNFRDLRKKLQRELWNRRINLYLKQVGKS